MNTQIAQVQTLDIFNLDTKDLHPSTELNIRHALQCGVNAELSVEVKLLDGSRSTTYVSFRNGKITNVPSAAVRKHLDAEYGNILVYS